MRWNFGVLTKVKWNLRHVTKCVLHLKIGRIKQVIHLPYRHKVFLFRSINTKFHWANHSNKATNFPLHSVFPLSISIPISLSLFLCRPPHNSINLDTFGWKLKPSICHNVPSISSSYSWLQAFPSNHLFAHIMPMEHGIAQRLLLLIKSYSSACGIWKEFFMCGIFPPFPSFLLFSAIVVEYIHKCYECRIIELAIFLSLFLSFSPTHAQIHRMFDAWK